MVLGLEGTMVLGVEGTMVLGVEGTMVLGLEGTMVLGVEGTAGLGSSPFQTWNCHSTSYQKYSHISIECEEVWYCIR